MTGVWRQRDTGDMVEGDIGSDPAQRHRALIEAGSRRASWLDGLVTRATNYAEVDEARAAAEQLAEERG